MTEVKFEKDKKGWTYVGRTKQGKPKFRKYTGQSLEYVKEYLDNKGIAYLVHEKQALLFIYKDKEPTSSWSRRYSYYYTTGRWGKDRGEPKHFHSEGIENFIEDYFKTTEQEKAYWDELNALNSKH